MRIYSKKAFSIGPGAIRSSGEVREFITVPLSFQSMPDQYANDPTFKLAVSAGDITIIENATDAKKAEMSVMTPPSDDDSTPDPIQEFYEKLRVMNAEETHKLAEQYDVKLTGNEKLGNVKKRILEAYKLSVEDEDGDVVTE